MKLLEKVLSFETKEQLRDWFNQGSASAPRIMMHSTEPIMKDGKEVWLTKVCLTGHDDPMILQNRIGLAFMHIRKEFSKHVIGLTDRAYHKIKFYDPEYRETHPRKRPEKAHVAYHTAIADAFAMAEERKKSKEVYSKTRNYQLGYSDRRTKKDPRMKDDAEYMRGYNARVAREEMGGRERKRGLRKNSMTWILVEYIKNHGGEVTRKHLTEQFGKINGALITRMLKSGKVESLDVGRYIHQDNVATKVIEPVIEPVPTLPSVILPQVMPDTVMVSRPYEEISKDAFFLRQRMVELEAENARLKKALMALTG